MKKPAKGDGLRIKCGSTSEIFEETCYESRLDLTRVPYVLQFDIATSNAYEMNVQYWLVSIGGEELGASVVSISPTGVPDWKLVVFSALIPGH